MKALGRDGAKAPHVICAFGVEPLRVSIGIADYQSSRLPGGRPAAIPRQRSAWRPLGAGKARSAMPDTAALRQASMVSAGRWPARALGARRLSRSVVFFLPRVPMPFLATVARLRPDARVRCAQSSPGPSLRSGCGFRAGPCIWAPPGSFSRTAWGSREAGKTKAPTDREDPKRRQRGLLKAGIFNRQEQ